MQKNRTIGQILGDIGGLQELSQILLVLDELNRILHSFLPGHLVDHCHVGAINSEKNLVIIYLANSSVRHIIENMANPILENFNNHHFSFAGLVTRIRPQTVRNPPRFKQLNHDAKSKLAELAKSINRPDLIENETIIDYVKEIEL
ncbi:MAG: hypothetical protein K0R14_510 [Burkholderiales bacterium]|jgi:hypothetical protein|nr:hypothetical protein [Burkholderiales bacterium]